MNSNKSREAVLEFLTYVAQKGLIAPATAHARKVAVGKILGILDENEAQDVTAINLDEVVNRFANLEGKNYTPGSMNTYKSRVRSALDDFISYVANPLAFKPGLQSRERKPTAEKVSGGESKVSKNLMDGPLPLRPMASSILPIPIRADLTIHIQGLPFDLTPAEANKIASVVKAMAAHD